MLQGSAFYMSGVVLVLWGWPVVGILLESYGFFLLFRGFIPTVLGFMRRIPGLGSVLDLPGLKSVSLLCSLPSVSSRAWLVQFDCRPACCTQVINWVAPAQSAGLPY